MNKLKIGKKREPYHEHEDEDLIDLKERKEEMKISGSLLDQDNDQEECDLLEIDRYIMQ